MNVVDIGQACDTLHVDLFNSISQKSNNEKNYATNLQKYSVAILKADLSWVIKIGKYIRYMRYCYQHITYSCEKTIILSLFEFRGHRWSKEYIVDSWML